jgi:hypothetical protein
MLESNTAVLYTALADRVTLPTAKSVLLEVAADSQKHSLLLRSTGEKLAKSKSKPGGSEKISEVFNVTYAIYRDIIAQEQVNPEELLAIAEKLLLLEQILGEKYAFVWSKTQKLTEKQLNPLQKVSLDNLGSLFVRLIHEGQHHGELLGAIMTIIEQNASVKADLPMLAKCAAPAWAVSSSATV